MARSHSPADLDDFWQEFKDIESNKDQDVEEEETAKTPDEGEREAAWLHDAGYGFLVSKHQAGKELTEEEIHALTSSLPSNHAAVVKRRVDTLNATLKKKQRYSTKIDVRNIFPQQPSTDTSTNQNDPEMGGESTGIKPQRPTTLPHGMKFSQFVDNSWIRQTSPAYVHPKPPRIFTFPSHVFYNSSKLIPNPSQPTPNPSHPTPNPTQSTHTSSYSSTPSPKSSPSTLPPPSPASNTSQSDASTEPTVKQSKSAQNIHYVYYSDYVDGLHRRRSDSHSSESSITSPSRSKSSSCNTLDSLDSGLESSNSVLNKDTSSSRDSLDSSITSQPLGSPPGYQVGLFSPVGSTEPLTVDTNIDVLCSPFGSPKSPIGDSSPTLVAFRKPGSSSKMPRSPTSPRNEVVHPEFANNRPKGRPATFVKNKGGYSMSGVTEEVQGNAELGVEMLSVQQRGSVRNSQLSPISDSDITFDFNLEENGTSRVTIEGPQVTVKSITSDNLPNFCLVHDPLGITCIGDISEPDQEYIRNKALLELTSMYDTHNIVYSTRRTKKRHKEHGLFGVPLQTIAETDQRRASDAHIHIPLVFQEIISYLVKYCLDTEGILRIPGSSSRIKQLRQELEEKFYQGTFIWGDDLTSNDVAALMKQFLRELPTPLLTNEYIDAFAQVENLPDKKQQLHALNLLVLLLPPVHRDTLHALLEFLDQVIHHSDTNKMSLNNVAMIMAPNLFMSPKVRNTNKSKAAWDLEIKMAAGTSNIMKMMIKYRHILWTVPSSLMKLVRRQYEIEQIRRVKDKSKIKFLAKKDKTEVYKKPALKHESDFQEGVIRIQAPSLTKSSTALQLDPIMTAGDVVSKFKVNQGSQNTDPRVTNQHRRTGSHGQVYSDPRNFTSAGDNTFLFEVGGNIGERCLPNDTNMMALYKVNPNAEWIIKQREQ